MKTRKPQTNFPILNLLWAPLLTLLVNHAFFSDQYLTVLSIFLGATAIALPVFFLLSQMQVKLSVFLRKRYPQYQQRKTRFGAWIFVSLPMTLTVIVALWALYTWLPFFTGQVKNEGLRWAIILSSIIHILAIIVNEGQYTYTQWKEAMIESERLQKVNWESRYEGLKKQVNPHFLFNSINTLSSLIHEDRAGAGQYVKEMSQVYRYLLRNNDDSLVPLQQELRFIQSYFHLLKMRFGTALHLQINVPPSYASSLLPPLTLQMLVENAVKHNNVSKEAPLTIIIECTADGWLAVKNNLQPKHGRIDSTGIGLANIREKYRLLGLPEVQVQSTSQDFVILIPLVEQLVGKRLKSGAVL